MGLTENYFTFKTLRKENSIKELNEQKALQAKLDEEWSPELTDEEAAEAARKHARFLPFYESTKGLITFD